jgi:hypothetical protein
MKKAKPAQITITIPKKKWDRIQLKIDRQSVEIDNLEKQLRFVKSTELNYIKTIQRVLEELSYLVEPYASQNRELELMLNHIKEMNGLVNNGSRMFKHDQETALTTGGDRKGAIAE